MITKNGFDLLLAEKVVHSDPIAMKFKLDMSCHLLNVSNWYLKACWKSLENSDGQMDGHCYGIIRPFFKQEYKTLKLFHTFTNWIPPQKCCHILPCPSQKQAHTELASSLPGWLQQHCAASRTASVPAWSSPSAGCWQSSGWWHDVRSHPATASGLLAGRSWFSQAGSCHGVTPGCPGKPWCLLASCVVHEAGGFCTAGWTPGRGQGNNHTRVNLCLISMDWCKKDVTPVR